MKGIKYPKEIKKQVKKLYKRGYFGYRKVAHILEIPHSTVRSFINPTKFSSYRENSPSNTKEYQKKLYWKHPEKAQQYRRKNRETLQGGFNRIKRDAIRRKKEFTLSLKEIRNFFDKKCAYCGEKIKGCRLDRIDNDKGYIKNNIISCCSICNIMKGKLTKKEFIKKCKKVAGFARYSEVLTN
mgnify:CR=1 FL=1